MPLPPIPRLLTFALLILAFAPLCLAQDNSKSIWNSSSQRQDPQGNQNPLRTSESHTESDGRTVDRKTLQTLGPDGTYVPYLETESETVHVDTNTTRIIRRSYGTNPDGERKLLQQTLEETHTSGGEANTVRTTSNPDANGSLQVVQRELQHSRQLGPDVQETKTTVLTPDANGGLSPAMQIEERQKKNNDGTIDFKKSTSLPDGAGNWQIGEVREGKRLEDRPASNSTSQSQTGGTTAQNSPAQSPQPLEERVLRPDTDGNLATVERTVTRQSQTSPGETRKTSETFSVYVPGNAGNDGPQLVQRETSVSRSSAAGDQTTTRQIEKPSPGSPVDGLRVTEQTTDIVRPVTGGVANQNQTIVTFDANGTANTVWVDTGKTNNPAVLHVDTNTSNSATSAPAASTSAAKTSNPPPTSTPTASTSATKPK